jgi:5-methylcytosine-specific restriction endonuclease McrA
VRPLGVDEIRIIDDPHHPRGYREWVGRNVLARRKQALLNAPGKKRCYVCNGEFYFGDGTPTLEHIIPKGAGGATHDDSMSNLALSHWRCNQEKGSRRI